MKDDVPLVSYRVSRTAALVHATRPFVNIHRPGSLPNVFVASLPRSGSTWLMELIWSQPGFKPCDEPTDLRNPYVRKHLGITEWGQLYSDDAGERLFHYFDRLCNGQLGFLNPRPFRRYYRPATSRIVFKVIHGCEGRLNWLRDTFDGRIVYLVRHPVAVSLSREVLPTLPAMLDGPYRSHFTREQLEFAADIVRSGSKLERGVLSWCLQTSVPLHDATDDWVIASYEQLILDPATVVRHLAAKLELPNPQRMLDAIATPSQSSRKSDSATRKLLNADAPTRAQRLVEKWRDQVSDADERRAMEILDCFDIDFYRAGDPLPDRRYWLTDTD
ncbi:MAG TPA: sulfotransferase [Thermomicrobiales bacterium]|nr:sulfotransferase [Thermomicrobiales bacterium]